MCSSSSKDKYWSDKPSPEFEDRRRHVSKKRYYEWNQSPYWKTQSIVYTGNNPGLQSRPSEWYYENNLNATMNPCYDENEWVTQPIIPQRYVYTEFNRTDRGQYGAFSPDYTEYGHADYR
ncbi:hypothetical protein DPMN_112383 [Dreissena polymorpha]|uniref:Uncharacterized protein n=1 Tax=Dreissena polymorpha TaxID=45954 RepID=A0A9D4QQU5_DREPO|nr:hypothetical protein DPMN_112383 [Dreissena polymorpha]